jgi:hypothetical protein
VQSGGLNGMYMYGEVLKVAGECGPREAAAAGATHSSQPSACNCGTAEGQQAVQAGCCQSRKMLEGIEQDGDA